MKPNDSDNSDETLSRECIRRETLLLSFDKDNSLKVQIYGQSIDVYDVYFYLTRLLLQNIDLNGKVSVHIIGFKQILRDIQSPVFRKIFFVS